MTKRFEPITDKCGEIVDYMMSSEDMPEDETLLFKIRLSVEEAVSNVVNYAYIHGEGWIEVGTSRDGNLLVITLKDSGKPFDPLGKPDPDLSLPAEQREIGGLGIFLCKKMMDSIGYEYSDGCNVLTMTITV